MRLTTKKAAKVINISTLYTSSKSNVPLNYRNRTICMYLEVESHATLFSWSTWLAAWIAGACAQR